MSVEPTAAPDTDDLSEGWLAWIAAGVFWLWQPGPRNVLAWILALVVAFDHLETCWWMRGVDTCDFAGQWLMGRMFYWRVGHQLYLVEPERVYLKQGYPDEVVNDFESQILKKGHADDQNPNGIEGPLYPPTAALVFWPIGVLKPPAGHAVMGLIYLLVSFVTARLLSGISGGRLRTGEWALLVVLFPNLRCALILGQNSALTLLTLTAGWRLWQTGRPFLGGLVWGLLAFKPVFAVALIWVPLLRWNWRFLTGMALGGATFVLATLPFLLPPEGRTLAAWAHPGDRVPEMIAPWLRWRIVGEHASLVYTYDRNWVWMSRDLMGLPRRDLWTWDKFAAHVRFGLGFERFNEKVHQAVNQDTEADGLYGKIGAGLMIGLMAVTILGCLGTRWFLRHAGQPPTVAYERPRDAFLLIGAMYTTYHFMHYDMIMFCLPVALLLWHALERPVRLPPTRHLLLGLVTLTAVMVVLATWAGGVVVREQLFGPATAAAPPVPAAAQAGEPDALEEAPLGRVAFDGLLWVLAFVGLPTLVGAWAYAAYVRSWITELIWLGLLLACTLDLGWNRQGGVRFPLEMFLYLIAWLWAGVQMIDGLQARPQPAWAEDLV